MTTSAKFKHGTLAHKEATKALKKKLDAAREVVCGLPQLSDEWEDAMVKVRALCEEIDQMTDFGVLTSVDGDIWSVGSESI